jgi:hypothetical protein
MFQSLKIGIITHTLKIIKERERNEQGEKEESARARERERASEREKDSLFATALQNTPLQNPGIRQYTAEKLS